MFKYGELFETKAFAGASRRHIHCACGQTTHRMTVSEEVKRAAAAASSTSVKLDDIEIRIRLALLYSIAQRIRLHRIYNRQCSHRDITATPSEQNGHSSCDVSRHSHATMLPRLHSTPTAVASFTVHTLIHLEAICNQMDFAVIRAAAWAPSSMRKEAGSSHKSYGRACSRQFCRTVVTATKMKRLTMQCSTPPPPQSSCVIEEFIAHYYKL